MLLNTADLQLHVSSRLSRNILIISLVLLESAFKALLSFFDLVGHVLLILLQFFDCLLQVGELAMEPALQFFHSLMQPLLLVLSDKALLAGLLVAPTSLRHLRHSMCRLSALALNFSL